MRLRFFVIMFSSILFFAYTANAQQVELNLKGLTEAQKAELVIQAEKMKKEGGVISEVLEPSNLNPQKLNEWVDLGKNVGLALTAVAKELGVASDQFLESKTGQIALVLIVWKVMGKDILDVVGGTLVWTVLSGIIIWSFRFFHMTKKVKQADGKVEYIKRYEFKKDDTRAVSGTVHVVAFGLTTLVCMIIIF